MLSANDIQWIKQNREEIIQGRTEVIDAKKNVQTGSDPITREPVMSSAAVTVEVIWEEVDALRDGELKLIDGIEIEQGDVKVTLKAEDDPQSITYLIRAGKRYRLIAFTEKGIGVRNRWVCVAREVI